MLYLLHFEKPLHHAQHYVGATSNLRRRLILHAHDKGAKIIKKINSLNIKWELARVWKTEHFDGIFWEESLMKKMKNGSLYCPICYKHNPRLFNKMDEYPLSFLNFPIYSEELKKCSMK